jgi:DNA end-binding protein Ku
MEALRRSVGQEAAPAKAPKRKKAASGQKEMLMPIDGKKTKETAAKKRRPSRNASLPRASIHKFGMPTPRGPGHV